MPPAHSYRHVLQGVLAAALILHVAAIGLIGAPARADDAAPSQPGGEATLYVAELEKLADKCDELGLAEQAKITRNWAIPRDGRRQYLFLPQPKDPLAPPKAAPLRVQQWYTRFRAIRQAEADRLYDLALSKIDADPAAAYRMLHEALREDPDHERARRALGYSKNGANEWLPKPAGYRAEVGKTDHPRLGWRRGKYWRIETPHYQILTDRSAKAGLDLAEELETLVAIWQQVFFDFWADSNLLKQRSDRRADSSPPTPKMQVVLFKDRDEYLATLGPGQPQIAVSLGLYVDSQKTAYFYAADPAPRSTWLHEATHQLFQELGKHRSGAGERQNFWILEGAAMYMESLTEHDGYWTVGGWEAERLQPARYRALAGDFLVPLEKLVALGREQLQSDPDIRRLYTQAAGLTHFLMDGQNGAYRRATIDYLLSVYQQTDSPQSLAAATKTSLAELDKQYLAFLQVTDDDLASAPGLKNVTQLSLGRTGVTDRGLEYLKPCERLLWLDLSQTKVTDAGLKNLASAKSLQQLFLEGTQVTDASLPLLAELTDLEELDLNGLPIRDDALRHLRSLTKLKTLYLAGSPITDAGLAHLVPLKKLESLDVRGAKVTADGLRGLQAARPNLKIDGP